MYIVTTIFILTASSACADGGKQQLWIYFSRAWHYLIEGFPLRWHLDSNNSVWAEYNDKTTMLTVTLMTTNVTDYDRNAVLYRETKSDRCRALTSEPEENHTAFKFKRIFKLPLTDCPRDTSSHEVEPLLTPHTNGWINLSISIRWRLASYTSLTATTVFPSTEEVNWFSIQRRPFVWQPLVMIRITFTGILVWVFNRSGQSKFAFKLN